MGLNFVNCQQHIMLAWSTLSNDTEPKIKTASTSSIFHKQQQQQRSKNKAMSSFSIFQAWTSRFPQSELPAAWEEDVRANLSKHRTKVIILSFIIVVDMVIVIGHCHRTKVMILSFIIVVDMVIVILVIQVNLSKHRTKVMISSRQGGNHNHCNCHPHHQSHRYRTEVFDLCSYHIF